MHEPIDLDAIRAELRGQVRDLEREIDARTSARISTVVEILRAIDFELLRQDDREFVAGLALGMIRTLLLKRLEQGDDE